MGCPACCFFFFDITAQVLCTAPLRRDQEPLHSAFCVWGSSFLLRHAQCQPGHQLHCWLLIQRVLQAGNHAVPAGQYKGPAAASAPCCMNVAWLAELHSPNQHARGMTALQASPVHSGNAHPGIAAWLAGWHVSVCTQAVGMQAPAVGSFACRGQDLARVCFHVMIVKTLNEKCRRARTQPAVRGHLAGPESHTTPTRCATVGRRGRQYRRRPLPSPSTDGPERRLQ